MTLAPLHEQLRQAWERSGWSLAELAEKSGVACGENSLSRKLRGKQPLSTIECEQLATTLGVVVIGGAMQSLPLKAAEVA